MKNTKMTETELENTLDAALRVARPALLEAMGKCEDVVIRHFVQARIETVLEVLGIAREVAKRQPRITRRYAERLVEEFSLAWFDKEMATRKQENEARVRINPIPSIVGHRKKRKSEGLTAQMMRHQEKLMKVVKGSTSKKRSKR